MRPKPKILGWQFSKNHWLKVNKCKVMAHFTSKMHTPSKLQRHLADVSSNQFFVHLPSATIERPPSVRNRFQGFAPFYAFGLSMKKRFFLIFSSLLWQGRWAHDKCSFPSNFSQDDCIQFQKISSFLEVSLLWNLLPSTTNNTVVQIWWSDLNLLKNCSNG